MPRPDLDWGKGQLPRIKPRKLAEDALERLGECVNLGPTSGRGVEATVSASRAVLEHYRWLVDCDREDEKPLKELVAILGSPAAALAWMRERLPQLEAEVSGTEAVATARLLTEGKADEHQR